MNDTERLLNLQYGRGSLRANRERRFQCFGLKLEKEPQATIAPYAACTGEAYQQIQPLWVDYWCSGRGLLMVHSFLIGRQNQLLSRHPIPAYMLSARYLQGTGARLPYDMAYVHLPVRIGAAFSDGTKPNEIGFTVWGELLSP